MRNKKCARNSLSIRIGSAFGKYFHTTFTKLQITENQEFEMGEKFAEGEKILLLQITHIVKYADIIARARYRCFQMRTAFLFF